MSRRRAITALRPLAALSVAAASCLAAPAAQAGEELWLSMDQARRFPMMEGVARVLIVNPGVADLEVVSGREALLFGRTPGATDVLFYDADGREISQVRLRVRNPRDGVLTLYNGATRYSFSCTDRCEQSSMVGDGELMAFGEVERQAEARMEMRQVQPGGLGETAVTVTNSASPDGDAAPADATVSTGAEPKS